MRRASIQGNVEGPPTSATTYHGPQHEGEGPNDYVTKKQLDDLIGLLNNQLLVMSKWMETQDEKQMQNQIASLEVMRQYNESQVYVIHNLAAAVTKLEDKINSIDPIYKDEQQKETPIPPTPREEDEKTPSCASIEQIEIDGVLKELAPTEVGDESLCGEEEDRRHNLLENLTARSLRPQCSKVVAKRPALAPLRSTM